LRFASVNLEKDKHGEAYNKVVEQLEKGDKERWTFLKACLMKLGLEANHSLQPVPSLSPLHLSCFHPSEIPSLLLSWREIVTKSPAGQLFIASENDTFYIRNPHSSLTECAQASSSPPDSLDLSSLSISDPAEHEAETASGVDRIQVDYDAILKHIIVHTTDFPPYKETPDFNHALYYNSLSRFTGPQRKRSTFGQYLLYGAVVTSTSTLLEK
jgi:biotin---protein ligase